MKREDSSEPIIPRSVKPRRPGGFTWRPIIVMDYELDRCVFESGDVTDFWPGAIRLISEPSSIVIAPDAAKLTATLGELFNDEDRWQYRVTPIKRHVMKSNGEMSSYQVASTCVNFFGFQRANGHGVNLYHYPLDPYMFLRGPVENMIDLRGDDRLTNLMDWGRDVRGWCQAQDLKVSPTAGGLAAQLLRDSRFFPEARRKVPRATNDRVRPKLPGNYYNLYATPGETYTALYLDMSSSHHTIASQIAFPHPDHLVARGYFDVADGTVATVPDGRPWLKAGSRAFTKIMTQGHGLVYGKLTTPFLRDDQFAPPYMRNQGERMVWAYTNELPLIADLGGRWEYLTAAWVSFQTDASLNRYAQFALAQLEKADIDRRRWLKPTLLASYGILAAQARVTEFGFRVAKGGQPRAYPAGSAMLPAMALVGQAPSETAIANVLYRGMIEAEQRVRALDLARHVHGHGHRVLAIYADSLFTEGDRVPLLPDGWKVDGVLDGLVFDSATHFTSRQLSKLPGVRKDSSQRVQLLAHIRDHDRPRRAFPKKVRRASN